MKIQNDGSLGSAPLETTRTQPAPPEATSNAANGRTISGRDGDTVQISGISAHISEANAAESRQRADRVAELEALHSRGSYHVHAAKLSRALVSHAVQTAPGGKA